MPDGEVEAERKNFDSEFSGTECSNRALAPRFFFLESFIGAALEDLALGMISSDNKLTAFKKKILTAGTPSHWPV